MSNQSSQPHSHVHNRSLGSPSSAAQFSTQQTGKRLKPPMQPQIGSPVLATKTSHQAANKGQLFSRRLSPGAAQTSSSIQAQQQQSMTGGGSHHVSTPSQHNFQRGAISLSAHAKAPSSVSAHKPSASRVGATHVAGQSSSGAQQLSTRAEAKIAMSAAKKSGAKKSPDKMSKKQGRPATTVAFEAWVKSFCPPNVHISTQNQPTFSANSSRSTRSIKGAKDVTGVSSGAGAGALSAIGRSGGANRALQSQASDQSLSSSARNFAAFHGVSASEVLAAATQHRVRQQQSKLSWDGTNQEDETLDVLDLSKDQRLINQAAYVDEDALIQYISKRIPGGKDPSQKMLHQKTPTEMGVMSSDFQTSSHSELQIIEQQLQEEYKYVENLRRDLRIAEERQKALKAAAGVRAQAAFVGGNTSLAESNSRKNAILLPSPTANEHFSQTASSVQANQETENDFWSDSQLMRHGSKKFELEPPQEQIKEEGSLKPVSSKQKLKTAPSLEPQAAASDFTPELHAMSVTQTSFTKIESSGMLGNEDDASFGGGHTRSVQEPASSMGLQVKQNAFFEEYKTSLKKNFAKKASSPIMKSSHSSRLTTQMQANKNARHLASPTGATQSSRKTAAGKVHHSSVTTTPSCTSPNHTSGLAQTAHKNTTTWKQSSFIGSGLFKKGSNATESKPLAQDKLNSLPTELSHSFLSQKSLDSLPSQPQFRSFQGRPLKGGEQPSSEPKTVAAKGQQDAQQASYDFGKYQTMANQVQLEQLLRQKQDTPKGSSGSENGRSSTEEVCVEYIDAKQVSQIRQGLPQPQSGGDEVFGDLNPDPMRRVHHKSVIQKYQRSERKPVGGSIFKSVAQIEPIQSVPKSTQKDAVQQNPRARFLQSPSRNRPGLHLNTQGTAPAQTQPPASNLASHLFQQQPSTQSPPSKQNKTLTVRGTETQFSQTTQFAPHSLQSSAHSQGARAVQHQHGQPQRNTFSIRLQNASQAPGSSINQHSAKQLSGSPAVPALRANTAQGELSQPASSFNQNQRRRSRVSSPTSHEMLTSPVLKQARPASPGKGISQGVSRTQSQWTGLQESVSAQQVATQAERKESQFATRPSLLQSRAPQLAEADRQMTLEFALRFLLQEEEWLDQLQDLASSGNFNEMQAQGLLLPRLSAEFSNQTLYASLFQVVSLPKQRPKVFAMQLQIYVVIAALLTELLVLDQPTMRKFASKLDDVIKNCHQNFLLLIDFVIGGVTNPHQKKSVEYVLLKKVSLKKQPGQAQARANRLTTFRQKNELSRAFLKRVASEMPEQQIAKATSAVQELCSAVLEGLRMTVDENGMDIAKAPVNQKKVVQKLDQIYEQTVCASQAVQIATKKAILKKSSLNSNGGAAERKVKSVMRGGKTNVLNSAQKHPSPPPKRVRNAHLGSPLEARLQGHLFGVDKANPFQRDPAFLEQSQTSNALARASNYLQTVEETEHTEASPTKSQLQLHSELSGASPEHVPTLMPRESETSMTRVAPLRNNLFKKEMAPQPQKLPEQAIAQESVKVVSTKKCKASPKEKGQRPLKRASTLHSSSSVLTDSSAIKHVKTVRATSSKKSLNAQFASQQPRTATATEQRQSSPPLASKGKAQNGLQQQQSLDIARVQKHSSLLPENTAFILANSASAPSQPKASNSNPSKARKATVKKRTGSTDRTSSASPDKTLLQSPALQKQRSLQAYKDSGNMSTLTTSLAGRQNAQPVQTLSRRRTLQKTKSSQSQQAFQLGSANMERRRVNTIVTTSPSFTDKRGRRAPKEQAVTTTQQITQSVSTAQQQLSTRQLAKQGYFATKQQMAEMSNEEGQDVPADSALLTFGDEPTQEGVLERTSACEVELSDRMQSQTDNGQEVQASNTLIKQPSLTQRHEAQANNVSSTPDRLLRTEAPQSGRDQVPQSVQVSLFTAVRTENTAHALSLPVEREEGSSCELQVVEGISEVMRATPCDQREQTEQLSSKEDDFSLTEGPDDRDDDSSDEDDDGSLIFSRASITQSNTINPLSAPLPKVPITVQAARQETMAAVGAAITPREQPKVQDSAARAISQQQTPKNEEQKNALQPSDTVPVPLSNEQSPSFSPAQGSASQSTQFGIPLPLERLNLNQERSSVKFTTPMEGTLPQPTLQTQVEYTERVGLQPAIQVDLEDSSTVLMLQRDQSSSFASKSEAEGDELRLKFAANNFRTPRDTALDSSTQQQQPGSSAKASYGEASRQDSFAKTAKTKDADFYSPRVVMKSKSSLPEADEEDSTMKDHVEAMLNGLAGRRSSIRCNSLLFEEDSLQIKREMVRQKQVKKLENMSQRISLRAPTNGSNSRRQTQFTKGQSHDGFAFAPNSARDHHLYPGYHSKSDVLVADSSRDSRHTFQQIRSHSLVDIDDNLFSPVGHQPIVKQSTETNERPLNQSDPDQLVQSQPRESDVATTSIRIAAQKESEEAKFAINSPILGSVKIQSPRQEGEEADALKLETPPHQKFQKFNQSQASDGERQAPTGKGVKSAANAQIHAFDQGLLPKQEEGGEGAAALNFRSKSMVTNFMEIPDALQRRSSERRAEEEEEKKTTSFGFSNQGTFQTPERGHSSNLSPSNPLMKDIIIENAAEEDLTPDSVDLSLPPKQNMKAGAFMERQESFKTHAFESIESFVQLENQLLNRGDSLVSGTELATQPADLADETGAGSSNMIDEEQDQIDAELAMLRKQVRVPYLPPIDTSIISEEEVYTLVLDLDETLIHYECDDEDGDYYLIRPGAIRFLKEMALFYEIVIFTAAMPEYADKILDNLDENGFMIKHRLYRQHTTPTEDYAIKDLHLLGRQLSRTIIVDNLAENFQATTPNNGVWVESWYDDMEDTVLPRLQLFLQELVEEQVPDVRPYLTQQVKDQVVYAALEGVQQIPTIRDIQKHPSWRPIV